jgi:thiol-activated cytolysin
MTADIYINGLQYKEKDVLTDNSAIPNLGDAEEGNFVDGTYVITKRELHSESNENPDLACIDANAVRTYPGSMVLVDQGLIDNQPAIVNVKTKPVRFSIDLDLPNPTFVVDDLDKGTLDAAVNTKIAEWKSLNTKGIIAAKQNSSFTEVHSKHQIESHIGFKLDKANTTLDLNFDLISKGESREWILKYKQVYYNVTLGKFVNPSDIIDSSTTGEMLQERGVTAKSPIGIVNNVSYGRTIFVKFSTTDTSLDITGSVDLLLKGPNNIDAKTKEKYESLTSKLNTSVFVYGGGTGNTIAPINITLDKVNEFITSGVNFTADQKAAPIGYSVVFMKNGGSKPAVVNSTSTYITTKYERYDKSQLKIEQKAGYVARCEITWDEISYTRERISVLGFIAKLFPRARVSNNDSNQPLTKQLTARKWSKNGDQMCAAEKHYLDLPGNARNLHIKVEGCTGLAWRWWETSFNQSVDIRPSMTLKIDGTSLQQKAQVY